jgi:hypothetical protein
MLLLALLWAALGAAQEPLPATFVLSSMDPNSQSGFTDSANINVTLTAPTDWTCPIGAQDQCHLEYCVNENPLNNGGPAAASGTTR